MIARPPTKAARHQRIRDLLTRNPVRSQPELARLLDGDGVVVTQATLSRDLEELGAIKVRDAAGSLVYALPAEGGDARPRPPDDASVTIGRLRRRSEDLLVSVDSSGNLVVLRTPPGGAPFLASVIDHTVLPGVIGTVAGDDTVLLVTRDPAGGHEVAARLLALIGDSSPDDASPETADTTDVAAG